MNKFSKKSRKNYKKNKFFTRKNLISQKGSGLLKIGVKNSANDTITINDTFGNIKPNYSSLSYFHFTNLENVSTGPNKNPDYIYDSLFISFISDNIQELDTIKWSVNKFLGDLLIKLNNKNNTNKVQYTMKDLKINDFKFEFSLDKKIIILSGNVYIMDSEKLNKQIDTALENKIGLDPTNIVKSYIGK